MIVLRKNRVRNCFIPFLDRSAGDIETSQKPCIVDRFQVKLMVFADGLESAAGAAKSRD
jgi:hypothetical protein